MLKCKRPSGSEAWPRPVKPTTSTAHGGNETSADDYEGQQTAPSYQTSLSDAIQAALDNYDQTTAGTSSSSIIIIVIVIQDLYSRAATWSLKSPTAPFLNTWPLMSLNLKKWSLKSLFQLSRLNFSFIF